MCNQLLAQQTAETIFVKSPKSIYLGAMMKAEAVNDSSHWFLEAKPMSIVASTTSGSWSNPSFELTSNRINLNNTIEAYYRPSQQNMRFSYSMQDLSEYSRLSVFFGQNIDVKKLFKVTDHANELNKVVIHLDQVAFTLDMDVLDPTSYSAALVNNHHNEDSIIIVNSVSFGKKAVIVVESNQSNSTIRSIMRSEIEGEELSPTERALLSTFTFRIAIFGSTETIVFNNDKPMEGILNFFHTPDRSLPNPISFSALYIKDNSVFINEYYVDNPTSSYMYTRW